MVYGKDNKNHAVQIKPDVSGPGINIKYDSNGGAIMKFNVDIGASVKTYKSNDGALKRGAETFRK